MNMKMNTMKTKTKMKTGSKIKEIVTENGTIIYKTRRKYRKKGTIKPKISWREIFKQYKEISNDEYEQRLAKKFYSSDMRTWEHPNLSYRIRYTPIVFSVDFTPDNSYGAYVILYKKHNIWMVLHIGKTSYGRFHSLKRCVLLLEKYIKKYSDINKGY